MWRVLRLPFDLEFNSMRTKSVDGSYWRTSRLVSVAGIFNLFLGEVGKAMAGARYGLEGGIDDDGATAGICVGGQGRESKCDHVFRDPAKATPVLPASLPMV